MDTARFGRRLCIMLFVAALAASSWNAYGQERLSSAPPDALAPPATRKASPSDEAQYVRWLEERSMLYQAQEAVASLHRSGRAAYHAYAKPQSRKVVQEASVWVLGYPGSVITRPRESVIASWADPQLWDAFREIGIELLHTGPVNRAGGIRGREHTPTVDGWFDPISLELDPQLGTEQEYRRMVQVARAHGGKIAGDLVPLHTGKGADFLLALRAYKQYPGMYVMAEIAKEDWNVLPATASAWESRPVPKEAAEQLTRKGYIPGLIRSNDARADALALSGWDATGVIVGVDGKPRRWVYLHFFKPGQPTLDWIDPSGAAQRAVAGDLVNLLGRRGARGIRLDAVPFLGIEPREGSFMTWHYQHPLSVWGTDYLSLLARRLGGWTYQELNVPLDQLKRFTEHGPDLSYDFFTRTQVLHSLLIGDAALLRQAFRFLQDKKIEPVSLVHDLQNHDEITYQLVELDHRAEETFVLNGKRATGRQLRETILNQMRAKAAGRAAPYNRLYRPQRDGVATTFAGFVAASLGIPDPYHATPDQVKEIQRGHLLLAMANAMQPGVFGLSTWDLVGALPLPEAAVAERMKDQDYRWLNRGAVDLSGVHAQATRSAWGLPRAKALYGPLPEQLRDLGSFASQLKRILAARRRHRIALGTMVAAPDVANSSLCVLILRLPDGDSYAITALNFGREAIRERIDLSAIKAIAGRSLAKKGVIDAVAGKAAGRVGEDNRFELELERLDGKTLIVLP